MSYTKGMYNWSVDEASLTPGSPQHEKWRLEQLINFGLNGERLSAAKLRQYWHELAIDPNRRRFLNFLLTTT